MWHKAKKVSLTSGQTDVKLDFPLPIVACNLMIEYADFYENMQVLTSLTRAPLGYSAERAPLGGGGRFCPPCLTPELIGAARRARRRSKALNEKIPMHIKNFL